MTWVEMVREFHGKFGIPVSASAALVSHDRKELRESLIMEESDEVSAAMFDENLTEIADGLAGTIYVCIGAALEYGIDLDAVFAEVHRSNMTKTPGNLRADGKILKWSTFEPPRIAELLK